MTAGRLLILDRDGVINEDSDAYIKSVQEWTPLPGSIEAIARLARAGYRIAVATNQSGLARGLFSRADLDAMHQRLNDLVAAQGGRIELIVFCPHGPADNCDCRKPRPGLLIEIASRLHVDLHDALVVGDSRRDLEAALAVGATPWLVLTGKGQQTHADIQAQPPNSSLAGVPVFADLRAVANALLETQD